MPKLNRIQHTPRTYIADLQKALRAFTNAEEDMARSSFAERANGSVHFNQRMWKKADPEGYARWKRAIDLLQPQGNE